MPRVGVIAVARSHQSSMGDGVRLPFVDRAEAGRLLAGRVTGLGLERPLVLALPRGGVPIAVEVADRLDAPVEVLVTRKIGYPYQPELGVGAIAEGGDPVFDERLLSQLSLTKEDLEETVRREQAEITRRIEKYRGVRPLPDVKGRDVVVADDGLATGGTARAALRAVRSWGPERVVLGIPVAAAETVLTMAAEADDIIVLASPWAFRAVGQWYRRFEQMSDDDVIALLDRARSRRPGDV